MGRAEGKEESSVLILSLDTKGHREDQLHRKFGVASSEVQYEYQES